MRLPFMETIFLLLMDHLVILLLQFIYADPITKNDIQNYIFHFTKTYGRANEYKVIRATEHD